MYQGVMFSRILESYSDLLVTLFISYIIVLPLFPYLTFVDKNFHKSAF